MVSCARRKLLGAVRQAVFHCSTRCVRRAFLCGKDKLTHRDYSHRRRWIMQREEQLAQLFAIEIEFRAEMSNHLHLVLRTRPQIVRRWSNLEVARRWLTATKLAKCLSDDLPSPDPEKLEQLLRDKKKLKKIRQRLSSISWFLAILCENIARRANQEDGVTGRFWESRFKCRECTDENAILLCGLYVDLNPIRAGEAQGPEEAIFTSIYQRLQARQQRKHARDRADGWLGELTQQPERKRDEKWAYQSRSGRRASDLGLLSIQLEDYLKLLKWTAAELQSGRRQTIPRDLDRLLDKLDMDPDRWLQSVAEYDDTFCHAVGTAGSLAAVAERMGVSRLQGAPACRRLFG